MAEVVEIEADDLVGLAFAWLNELIGLAQARGEAVSRTEVSAVEETATGWRLRARAVFEPYTDDGGAARARLDVKSATFHRLEVGPADGGWVLTAYLDV
jgi:SHS2 domain-containing protein